MTNHLTDVETARLTTLEAAFDEAGGRGVDLAEEIDFLRRKRDSHDDPTIAAFLADGNYADIDAWMLDSDYVLSEDGDWCYPLDYADPEVAGDIVDPEGVIEGAIEACGFEA